MSYGYSERRRRILEDIEEKLGVDCAISIVTNPYSDPQQPQITLQHTREIPLIFNLLSKEYRKCNEIVLLIHAYNATIQFAEHLLRRMKSYGVNTFHVGVLDSALSMSALVPLIADKTHLLPWSVVGTVDPFIPSHNAPREALIVKESVEQAMASMPKEPGTGKGQVLYALSVSGSLYEYVTAEKYMKYVERTLYDFVRDRTTEERFSDLLQRILLEPGIHDQPLTAKELVELLPYASIVKEPLKMTMSDYFALAVDSLHRNNHALLIESAYHTYTVSMPTLVYTY